MALYLTIHIIVCVLLVAVILFQDGKAGGLTSVADTSQVMFGAKGAGSFLTKLTSLLAILFMVTSMSLAYLAAPSQKSIASGHEPPAQETEAKAAPADAGTTGVQEMETKKLDELTAEEREKLGVDKPAETKEDTPAEGDQKEQ